MSDQTPQSDKTPACDQPPPPMSPQVSNIHNSIYSVIEISKKHQWQITHYVILVYGVILGLAKYSVLPPEVLLILALVAWVYAVGLLILIQLNLVKYRGQLGSIYKHWLTERERKIILRPYWYPHFFRGGSFLFAFMGVVTIGAGLVGYLLRHT